MRRVQVGRAWDSVPDSLLTGRNLQKDHAEMSDRIVRFSVIFCPPSYCRCFDACVTRWSEDYCAAVLQNINSLPSEADEPSFTTKQGRAAHIWRSARFLVWCVGVRKAEGHTDLWRRRGLTVFTAANYSCCVTHMRCQTCTSAEELMIICLHLLYLYTLYLLHFF